jgi:hypothetical protein
VLPASFKRHNYAKYKQFHLDSTFFNKKSLKKNQPTEKQYRHINQLFEVSISPSSSSIGIKRLFIISSPSINPTKNTSVLVSSSINATTTPVLNLSSPTGEASVVESSPSIGELTVVESSPSIGEFAVVESSPVIRELAVVELSPVIGERSGVESCSSSINPTKLISVLVSSSIHVTKTPMLHSSSPTNITSSESSSLTSILCHTNRSKFVYTNIG